MYSINKQYFIHAGILHIQTSDNTMISIKLFSQYQKTLSGNSKLDHCSSSEKLRIIIDAFLKMTLAGNMIHVAFEKHEFFWL